MTSENKAAGSLYQPVDKKTFESFLREYPRELHRIVCGPHPFTVSYCDPHFGSDWPDNVAASVVTGGLHEEFSHQVRNL